MKDITELKRLASPAPKPQSLAWDGSTMWMGSRETKRIYAIKPATWTVGWEIEAPGTPYGMTAIGGLIHVLCGETADDNRIIRRCLPGEYFDKNFGIPCPDDTGSQLGYDGKRLHVSQWYRKRVLALSDDGSVSRVIEAPHGICGQVFVDGTLFLLTTDDEKSKDYWLTRVDLGGQKPKFQDLARVPFGARALAYDGTNFWTNHREENQIVCFPIPAIEGAAPSH